MFDVFFQIISNFYRPVTSVVLIWKQATAMTGIVLGKFFLSVWSIPQQR